MEAAIARGQGESMTGAALENLTLEVIMQPTVAMIIDIETDNKARAQQDLRTIIKRHGGTVTPTSYLFQKKGRIAFERDERNLGVDEVLDEAIEAGAEDVETDEDGSIVVWTEANKTTAAAEALQMTLGLKVETSDIIWDANADTKIHLECESVARALSTFIDAIKDDPTVQGVYANVAQGSISNEAWEELQDRLDA